MENIYQHPPIHIYYWQSNLVLNCITRLRMETFDMGTTLTSPSTFCMNHSLDRFSYENMTTEILFRGIHWF